MAAARGVILRVLCSGINPVGVEKFLKIELFWSFFFLLGVLGFPDVLRVAANLGRGPDTHDCIVKQRFGLRIRLDVLLPSLFM